MINPFVPNAPFLSPLKTSDFYTPWKRQKTFGWCFQGVEKECIGNKWVNGTKQTTTVYKLDTKSIQVTFNKKPLKRTFSFKLLVMLWDRYFLPFHVRKQRFNQWCFLGFTTVMHFLVTSQNTKKQLQKVQDDSVAFVMKKCGMVNGVLSLKWLSIEKRIRMSIRKQALKGLHYADSPPHTKCFSKKKLEIFAKGRCRTFSGVVSVVQKQSF